MIQKVFSLEDISLVDFLGVENANIKEVAAAFPRSKIVSRGNEIILHGTSPEVTQITDILNSLLAHYHKYGNITNENVKDYINHEIEDIEKHEPDKSNNDDVILFANKGHRVLSKSVNQTKLVNAVSENDMVFTIGPAGTGKTYLSVALAVNALKNREVKKIIITRPAVEAGENLGFLPGDLKEKIDPYIRPVYDALEDMIPVEKLRQYEEKNIIEIAPLAYMRGRTLKNAFIILDEAQNTTSMQLKMFLTRMGPNSKVIVNGDISQVDLPYRQKSGLREAMDILKDTPGIAFVKLEPTDVNRHQIVKDVIAAYDKHYFNNNGST